MHTHRMPPGMACSIYRSVVVPVCGTCVTAWWLIGRANDEPRGGVGATDTGGPREQSGFRFVVLLLSLMECRVWEPHWSSGRCSGFIFDWKCEE